MSNTLLDLYTLIIVTYVSLLVWVPRNPVDAAFSPRTVGGLDGRHYEATNSLEPRSAKFCVLAPTLQVPTPQDLNFAGSISHFLLPWSSASFTASSPQDYGQCFIDAEAGPGDDARAAHAHRFANSG